MKINKDKPPCDRFGFPLALNWNIVLKNQLEGKPLTQGAYITTNNNKNETMNKRRKNKEEIDHDKKNLARLEKLEGQNALKLIEEFAEQMSWGADITHVSCGIVLKLMEGIPCQLKDARKRIKQPYVANQWEEDCTAFSQYSKEETV